jgi:3-oxoacyl-[acyl-carrier protein] reductase
MVNDWKGQVALVSGAGSEQGIGLAIARRLGAAGAKLIITGSSARIHERVAQLSEEGYEVQGRAADLTQADQVAQLVAWAESCWGRIDVLVNNAGMAMQGDAEAFAEVASMSLDAWNASIARNLTTAFLLTRAVLPGMQQRRYGRIVQVSSTTRWRRGGSRRSPAPPKKSPPLSMCPWGVPAGRMRSRQRWCFWRRRRPATSPANCW